jgi:hypothetical protein
MAGGSLGHGRGVACRVGAARCHAPGTGAACARDAWRDTATGARLRALPTRDTARARQTRRPAVVLLVSLRATRGLPARTGTGTSGGVMATRDHRTSPKVVGPSRPQPGLRDMHRIPRHPHANIVHPTRMALDFFGRWSYTFRPLVTRPSTPTYQRASCAGARMSVLAIRSSANGNGGHAVYGFAVRDRGGVGAPDSLYPNSLEVSMTSPPCSSPPPCWGLRP